MGSGERGNDMEQRAWARFKPSPQPRYVPCALPGEQPGCYTATAVRDFCWHHTFYRRCHCIFHCLAGVLFFPKVKVTVAVWRN